MLVVSHTTGGGGVRASDVTHYFSTSTKLLLISLCKIMVQNGRSKFPRVENGRSVGCSVC